MILAHARFVLPKGDIQNPVQGIFDAPGLLLAAQQVSGAGLDTRNVVACLDGDVRAAAPFMTHPHDRRLVGELTGMQHMPEHLGIADRPGFASFAAAMAFVPCRRPRKLGAIRVNSS